MRTLPAGSSIAVSPSATCRSIAAEPMICLRPSRIILANPSRAIAAAAATIRGSSPSGRTMRCGRARARALIFSTSVITRPSYHRFAGPADFCRMDAQSSGLAASHRTGGPSAARNQRPRKADTIRHKGKKLKDILEAHEKFHKGHPGGERADLAGADLSGQDLKKRDLTGANLAGSNLRKADLRGAKLSHADLSGANLRQADLRNCDFTETMLGGADLSEADLSGTELFRGDLRSAKLHKTILRGTVLRQANLRGADFSGSDLALASFREIDLTEVKLDGAQLKDAVVRDIRKG